MKKKLTYSKRNKMLLLATLSIYAGFRLRSGSYGSHHIIGATFSLWLFPRIVSYVVYRATKRSVSKGQMVFDIMLVFFFIFKMITGPVSPAYFSAKNTWDGYKAELVEKSRAEYVRDLERFLFSNTTLDVFAECVADKAIAFLNTTECPYLYNPGTTSKEEHLAALKECLAKVGYEAKLEKYSFECMKANIPEDWSIMKKTLSAEFSAGFVESGLDSKKAKSLADCVSPGLVELMNKRACPLVNKAAEKPEDLVFRIDDCFKDSDNDKEFNDVFSSCASSVSE